MRVLQLEVVPVGASRGYAVGANAGKLLVHVVYETGIWFWRRTRVAIGCAAVTGLPDKIECRMVTLVLEECPDRSAGWRLSRRVSRMLVNLYAMGMTTHEGKMFWKSSAPRRPSTF